MPFTPTHNLSVRGQDNKNGTGQWITIGRLYEDTTTGKKFISMSTLALAPSLLMQVDEVQREIAVNLFTIDAPKAASRYASYEPDDIPF